MEDTETAKADLGRKSKRQPLQASPGTLSVAPGPGLTLSRQTLGVKNWPEPNVSTQPYKEQCRLWEGRGGHPVSGVLRPRTPQYRHLPEEANG